MSYVCLEHTRPCTAPPQAIDINEAKSYKHTSQPELKQKM